MSYSLKIETKAQKELAGLKMNDQKSFNKIVRLLSELQDHPTTGTGKPEQLKHELSGKWSRRINKKDRLIYAINELEMKVNVFSFKGHYE